MPALMLKLDSPIQSFGTAQDLYRHNFTALFPTYSTVLGMVANAMGMDREDDITELAAAFTMGTAIARPATVMSDYQNMGNGDGLTRAEHIARFEMPPKSNGKTEALYEEFFSHSLLPGYMVPDSNIVLKDGRIEHTNTFKRVESGKQLNKEYLVGGDFRVALVGDGEIFNKAQEALKNPARYLFVGRKNCPVNSDFFQGVVEASTSFGALYDSLHEKTLDLFGWEQNSRVEFIVPQRECPTMGVRFDLRDYPLSWKTRAREFAPRLLTRFTLDVSEERN